MIAPDRSLLDLDIKTSADDEDTLVSVVSGQASRVKIGLLSDLLSQWDNVNNKPFNSINSSDFSISTDSLSGSKTLGISSSIKSNSHNHTNKRYLDKISESNDGTFLYNNIPVTAVSEWNTILKKPFNSVSEDDFTVDENNMISIADAIKSQLHTHTNSDVLNKFSVSNDGKLLYDNSEIVSDGINFTSLSNMFVQGDNITISTDEVAQTITFSASGMDFTALSNALTTGTQNGISITADTDNNVFNFEVTGVPSLEIDSEGYWTINGERGENPTKAQGNDGFSPTAVVTDTENGATITITDKNGTATVDIYDGADGVSPHIDETTKHWFVGDVDTGIKAEGITTISTTSLTYIGNLVTDNWVGDTAPYTQTINITGITADNSPIIDLIVSDDIAIGKEEITQWSYITKATTGENIITFSCYEKKPSISMNFKVKVV